MAAKNEALAELIGAHRPPNASAGFPAWLRIRVGRHVRTECAAGTTLTTLARNLGVSRPTLKIWSMSQGSADSGGFARVVVDERAPASATGLVSVPGSPSSHSPSITAAPATFSLVSPHGFSLDGLTLEQALRGLATLR